MNNQPPVTMVAALPADYVKRNSRFFVRDGAAMLSPDATAEHMRRIERCADEMAGSVTYSEFEVKREQLARMGTMATNGLIYKVAQADMMAD
jgi:hypothetical protein